MEINISNKESTNMFETFVGVINIAPTKISGQYKIVVDRNLKLWLDDYTGRRVAIDKTNTFLSQVANFLQVKTILPNNVDLRYGGFQRAAIKSWHIPFYFGTERNETFPKYFCLSRVPNETLLHISTDINGKPVGPESDLYHMKYPFKYGEILHVVDLEKIGLFQIIDEINAEKYFEYPLYFNWEDANIKMFGYGITEGYPIIHTLDILNSMANQPYLEVLNNKILNTYTERKMFYPRFFNIEFEFEYGNEYTHFNNFMGYLAENVCFGQGKKTTLTDQNLYIKKQDTLNNLKWKQIDYFNTYTLDKYLNLIADGTINEVHERLPQFRFKTYRVQAQDTITILHPGIDDLFEYIVSESDIIESSLLETWIGICNKCTKLSGRNYEFTVLLKNNSVIVTIVNQLGDASDEDCIITIPTYYQTLDRFEPTDTNYNQFRGITQNDIWLCGQPSLTKNVNIIAIPNEEKQYDNRFVILDRYKFEDSTILRLDRLSGVDTISRAFIFEDKYEEVVHLKPIPFMSFYGECESEKPFDFKKYKDDLNAMFGTARDSSEEELKRVEAFKSSLASFNKEQQEPLYQYVYEDEDGELTDISKLQIKDYNEEIIKNMLFTSMGCTTYINPHLLNIDKQCFTQNGCVDSNQGRKDYLRYNWFLINGAIPKYLIDDSNRQLRYMNRIETTDSEGKKKYISRPKITSRLIRISDTLCETIFLGVKYQLPVQYENYLFCVYLNLNNQKDIELTYNIEVLPEENLLMVSINKYLDFNDLIRGGDNKNEPLVDLSLFYNISNSSNSTSDYLFAFKTCGIILEPFYDHHETGEFQPLFNGVVQHDWRVLSNGMNYFCIQREITASVGDANSFKLLFPTSGNAKFYVYSTVKYNEKDYVYVSMTLHLIGIKEVEDDYLWCEDIKVKFFDTKQMFLRQLNPKMDLSKNYRNPEIEQILAVDTKNIVKYEPVDNTTTWGENHQITTIIIDKEYKKYELLLPNREISFKQEYFEIHQKITENPDGSKNYFKTVFRFPEFNVRDLITDENIIDRFDSGHVVDFVPDTEYDTSIYKQMITIFDRNQIWRILQDVLSVDLTFKYLTEEQIRMLFDDLIINKLQDFSDYQSIQIINRSDTEWDNVQFEEKYIKLSVVDIDRNLAIWPISTKSKVNLINRYRTAYLPYMQLCSDFFFFQIKEYQKSGTLWNIYDEQFGGLTDLGNKKSATGLWKEVSGNIISSLFCKNADIRLTVDFKVSIDYRELLIKSIRYEECIITNDNREYIESLNKNLQKYIIERYADLLLEQFYSVAYVENELGQKLKYTIDNKKPNLLHFEDKNSYNSSNIDYRNLIFILKRK